VVLNCTQIKLTCSACTDPLSEVNNAFVTVCEQLSNTFSKVWNRTRLIVQHRKLHDAVSTPFNSQSLIFFKWNRLGSHYFLVYLFQLFYMFQSTMCPSSGELTVSMRHWYFSVCMVGCLVCCIFISTSLHVSGSYVPIIRITYWIYAALVFFTVYGWLPGLQTRQPPIQSEKYQCRTDTLGSPDDGHIVARNM